MSFASKSPAFLVRLPLRQVAAQHPSTLQRRLLPPARVSAVSQKRSRDGPSAAPGLTGKVSPVRTPLLQPAPRFGVLSGLSSHGSAIFHVSPTGGGHRHVLLGKGRGSPSPAEPTARAFTSTADGSEIRIEVSFPLRTFLFPFRSPFVLTSSAQNGACEGSRSLEKCDRRLLRGSETPGRMFSVPARSGNVALVSSCTTSASLRGLALLPLALILPSLLGGSLAAIQSLTYRTGPCCQPRVEAALPSPVLCPHRRNGTGVRMDAGSCGLHFI